MTEVMWRRWGTLALSCVVVAALAVLMMPSGARADGTDSISGVIFDALGNAVDGATVNVYSTTAPDTVVGTAQTSSTGTYSIGNLADGSYFVWADPASTGTLSAGTDEAPTYYGPSSDVYNATPVPLNAATMPTETISYKLLVGGLVAGKITNSSGAGVQNVEVYLCNAAGLSADLDELPGQSADSSCVDPVPTASNGSYTVSGVAPGTYYVYLDPSSVDTSTASNYTGQWYGAQGGSIGATEETNGTAITVTAGNTTENINQQLATGGEITGQISESANMDPVAGGVLAEDSTGVQYGYFATGTAANPTGPYTIYGLPAGTYYLYFYGPGGVYTDANSDAVADANGWYNSSGTPAVSLQTGTGVSVAGNGSSTNASMAMPIPGEISGTITANNSPLGGVEEVLFDSQDNPVGYEESDLTRSESDGTYEITDLTPGPYKVEFLPEGSANLAYQFYDNATSLSSASVVNVAASATPTSGINANLTTGGEITGTVTSAANGADVQDVTVELQDSNGDVLDSTETLANGTYTLAGVPSGSYYLEFIPEALGLTVYQSQYYGGEQVLSGSSSVAVTAGQTTSNINASLQSGTQGLEIPQITSTTPTISGTPTVGDKLTAQVSGWTSGTTFGYQWYADSKAISGATAATLALTAADYGQTITVQVEGMQSGYVWANATSAATKAVAAGRLKTVLPRVTGTLRVGHAVLAKTGIWTAGTKFTYQWYANGKKIVGARKATLKLGLKEYKKRLSVKVTGVLGVHDGVPGESTDRSGRARTQADPQKI